MSVYVVHVFMLQVSMEVKDWFVLDYTSPVVGKWLMCSRLVD